jgi:hypothetical protein
MKKYQRYEEKEDLNQIIGYLKGKYKNINQVKQCPKFKALSPSDKEYVLDELKSDGFKEASKKFELELSLRSGNVSKAKNILKDVQIPFKQEYSNTFIFKNKNDYEDAAEYFKKYKIEII